MLKILTVESKFKPTAETTGRIMFRDNPEFNFTVEAPMYWWLDCEFERFNFIFPKHKDLRFCFDSWKEDARFLRELKFILDKADFTDRQLMQILPLSTIMTARIVLTYQQIVEICENYQCGEYAYQELRNQWPTEREWADFCETLLDLRGVRDVVEV